MSDTQVCHFMDIKAIVSTKKKKRTFQLPDFYEYNIKYFVQNHFSKLLYWKILLPLGHMPKAAYTKNTWLS